MNYLIQVGGKFGSTARVCEMLPHSHLRSINPEARTVKEAAYIAYAQDKKELNIYLPSHTNESL